MNNIDGLTSNFPIFVTAIVMASLALNLVVPGYQHMVIDHRFRYRYQPGPMRVVAVTERPTRFLLTAVTFQRNYFTAGTGKSGG